MAESWLKELEKVLIIRTGMDWRDMASTAVHESGLEKQYTHCAASVWGHERDLDHHGLVLLHEALHDAEMKASDSDGAIRWQIKST